MLEEFHGNGYEGGSWIYKLLYGWGTLTANIWLPSLSELVGYDPNQYDNGWGTYFSAMQGLNLSVNPWTDANGGAQWRYFTQFNASGGGEAIMRTSNQQASWTRSPLFNSSTSGCAATGGGVGHVGITASFAVHPAVCRNRNKFHIVRNRFLIK